MNGQDWRAAGSGRALQPGRKESPPELRFRGLERHPAEDYPSIGFSTPNSTSAMRNVTTILKAWAARNAHSRLRFSRETISLRRVSSPTQTKASEKNTVENILATPGSASLPLASAVKSAVSPGNTLNTSDAATKPMMNFGNFSHTIPSDGACLALSPRRVER